MNVFLEKLIEDGVDPIEYKLMRELNQVFAGNYDISGFANKLLND